ncbi:hypothetical protein MNBD_NITROSPINAE02-782 [hydrothermal vent metagenome]|uniref:Phosphatidic acid phosphatase type 2/haloperoxidase domain-containing protein n=1 Tax=hydrothermal vent metagenome TaxID=652676 RepID=A0A3B1BUP2_9ZZZZ
MDEAWFHAINTGLASPTFDWLMIKVTHKENWIVPLLLFLAALLYIDYKKGLLAIFVGALAVAIGDPATFYIIKPFFGRMRPCVTIEDARALVSCAHSFSFPSNHAVNSFAVAASIGNIFRPALFVLIPVAMLVALSRVAVGAHYPSDVLFGAVLGLGLGFGLSAIGKRYLLKNG